MDLKYLVRGSHGFTAILRTAAWCHDRGIACSMVFGRGLEITLPSREHAAEIMLVAPWDP